jgi:FkbM family methyltransferase
MSAGKSDRKLRRVVEQVVGGTQLRGLDVGARGGIPHTWLPLDGIAEFVCVEPDPDACAHMRQVYDRGGSGHLYKILPVALSAADGDRTLFLTNRRSGSSLFNPDNPTSRAYADADYLFPIETTTVATRAAGAALTEAGIERVDFAKLDAQGCELEILSALTDQMHAGMLCVEMEVALQKKGSDYPTFPDVHNFMLSKGLELFDVRVLRRHRVKAGRRDGYVVGELAVHAASPSVSARVYEFDTVYFRPCERVIATGDANALRRLVACFCMYGFFAEALHAAYAAGGAGLLANDASEQLAMAVKAWHRTARMRWRWRVGALFDLARWPIKYLNLEERPAWWPYR